MSLNHYPFSSRPTSPSACMTGWQACWPQVDLQQWQMQLDWPPSLPALTEWWLQCWTAPLSLAGAWLPAASAPAGVAAPQPEVVDRVVVSMPLPSGRVSVELVEVRLEPPAPALELISEVESADENEDAAPAPSVAEVVDAAPAVVEAAAAAVPAGPVSINHGSEAELVALKGIGPALARLIIAQRPYASIEALIDLKGIGPKLVEQLRDQLTL
ncbi:MAG: hypothetical protein RJA44_1037 [Pseudomonadota bacterium]